MASEFDTLISEGKNATPVFCPCCKSKVLAEGTATFFSPENKVTLPPLVINQPEIEDNLPQKCWCVENIYGFENVGFSRIVANSAEGQASSNCKFLCCADCEAGPLGWHNLITKKSYVDLSRIRHNLEQQA